MSDMAVLQFYKNNYRYPQYSDTITVYGSPMDCTPVGVNLRSGTLRVRGEFTDFMACNYLSLTRDGKTIYAWIEDVRFRTEDSFDVSYSVDAWRTYKDKIELGVQYIKRSPTYTNLRDPLLGSTQPYMDIDSTMYLQPFSETRVMVIQVRADTDTLFSNAPVQPTPYLFYLTRFNINSWQDNTALSQLMSALVNNAETKNIVTMYSIPYMDIENLNTNPLSVKDKSGNVIATINGLKCIEGSTDASGLLYLETPLLFNDVDNLMKVPHSVQIVIPEAGILPVPDELIVKGDLCLRQDVDIFSGASNYMLKNGDFVFYDHSVRGSSVSSIPILSDPLDTYLSQNQNGLATSLIGDVASIAMGAGLIASTGGIGAVLGGSASIAGGLNGLMNTAANIGDAGNSYNNPPAFLGNALAANFNQKFWVVTKRQRVDNEAKVRTWFSYPYNMVDSLVFPDGAGYIQTEKCNVNCTNGSVPKWAIDEINAMFDNGVLVR